MKEQMERIEIPFTYTYDQFTVFFHDDHVFIGERDVPIGQCCVDIMNLDEQVLHEIKGTSKNSAQNLPFPPNF